MPLRMPRDRGANKIDTDFCFGDKIAVNCNLPFG